VRKTAQFFNQCLLFFWPKRIEEMTLKGKEMKYLVTLLLLVFAASGCVHYADIERIQLGMTAEALMRMDTPCYYRGTRGEKVFYNCKFNVSSGEFRSGRVVKPYVLTFENNALTEIDLDERELDRQQIQDWYYYDPGFYHPYGYPYYPRHRYRYGHPYGYP
jgi:hypothetical protein